MRNELVFFYHNFNVFGQIEISLNGQNCFEDKFDKLPCMRIHCSLRMQENGDESEIYNYQQIQLSNNKFINGIFGGTLDLA